MHEDGGLTPKALGRQLGLAESSVRTIVQMKDKLRQHYAEHADPRIKSINPNSQSMIMKEMETLLFAWIQDHNSEGIALSVEAIKSKAKEIYNDVKFQKLDEWSENDYKETFEASTSWYTAFKDRKGLHKDHIQGRVPLAWSEIE